MKNFILRFSFMLACMALFSFGATAQQSNSTQSIKKSTIVVKNTASQTTSAAYNAAKKKFKQEKPNATREEINQFLAKWKNK